MPHLDLLWIESSSCGYRHNSLLPRSNFQSGSNWQPRRVPVISSMRLALFFSLLDRLDAYPIRRVGDQRWCAQLCMFAAEFLFVNRSDRYLFCKQGGLCVCMHNAWSRFIVVSGDRFVSRHRFGHFGLAQQSDSPQRINNKHFRNFTVDRSGAIWRRLLFFSLRCAWRGWQGLALSLCCLASIADNESHERNEQDGGCCYGYDCHEQCWRREEAAMVRFRARTATWEHSKGDIKSNSRHGNESEMYTM